MLGEGLEGGQGRTADVGGVGSDLKVRVRTWTLRSPEGVGGRAGRDCIARRLVVSQEE